MEEPTVVRVRQVVANYCGRPIEGVLISSTLQGLEFDSLDVVKLTMELEEEFKIVIPVEDIPQFEQGKIADIVLYIDRVLKEVQAQVTE